MKKLIVLFITILVVSTSISCKPSVVTDAKIESKYSYTSDQNAVVGILKVIYDIEGEWLNYTNIEEIAEYLSESFFDEEEEIGKWIKLKFGLEIRKGEMAKIIYTYNGEKSGFDIVYKPYNNDIFPKNIISNYDFITTLGNNNPPPSNNKSSHGTQTSNNHLANTKWERIEDNRETITFGQNSFSFVNRYIGVTYAGTYILNGDSVAFTIDGVAKGGSLIGNTLTAFNRTFKRIE